jgi:hypothetical protein
MKNKIEINEATWNKLIPSASMKFTTFVDGAYSNPKTKRKPGTFKTIRYLYAEDIVEALSKRRKNLTNKESTKNIKQLKIWERMILDAEKILELEKKM